MNNGKIMEQAWRKAAKNVDGLYYQRMNDGTATFYGGQAQEGIRFQQRSPYDCFMFHNGKLYLLELKHHKGNSLPFNAIREQQLEHLASASRKYENVVAGFVVMFAEKERCFYVSGDKVQAFKDSTDRKSIPLDWFIENGKEIGIRKMKLHYEYDVGTFVGKEIGND